MFGLAVAAASRAAAVVAVAVAAAAAAAADGALDSPLGNRREHARPPHTHRSRLSSSPRTRHHTSLPF